ncbi:berberine bridge enzyme-like Cyn d 4 [Triticum urartu]|uniref:berberine bridge enzyme-like Cyn d 4 n=1 Tax=Triticum urartu TaxID=4572 RepID=UPI002044C8ED|nr:berberine bridge enzyme-like Cyn d 4 [Triticum urartu]
MRSIAFGRKRFHRLQDACGDFIKYQDATFSKATYDYFWHAIASDVSCVGRNLRDLAREARHQPHDPRPLWREHRPRARGGVLYSIQYMNFWAVDGDSAALTTWVRDVYTFMEPHVSKNPREAYVNYRDLDLGENVVGADNVTSYEAGKLWGEKYYKDNFRRLAMAKRQIDPHGYFRKEQSITPLDADEQRVVMRNVAVA